MGMQSQDQAQQMLADAVEENLKKYANRNRVRFREFFRDFDKRRSNEVSDAHFRTGLSYIKVTFTELELQALANKYRNPSSGRVRYADFCDSIETVFTTKGLERMPTAEVPSITAEAFLGPRQLSDADEMDLMELMERVKERVRVRRLQIKPIFQDYDRKAVTKTISKFCHRVGTVTKAQFKQGLAIALSGMPFNEREYDLLCRKFDENGDVNYVAFAEQIDAENMVDKTMPATGINTISELHEMRERPIEMYQRFDTFRSDDALMTHDNETVMVRIKALAYKNRLRIHEFFRDYDKLRNGTVTIPQFRIVLDMLKIRITEQEFDDLANKYRASGYPNHVLWTVFADEVDSVFTQKGQERAPTAQTPGPPDELFVSNSQKLTADNELKCAELLDVLRETAHLRAVNIKAYFQDFDRGLGNQLQNLFCHKLSHVTRSQFREAVQMLFPTLLFQPEDYELLCDKYIIDPLRIDRAAQDRCTALPNRVAHLS
jgi:Ca2+-binding EF-hand superfamily protein